MTRSQLSAAIARRRKEIVILEQAILLIAEDAKPKKRNSNKPMKEGFTCEQCGAPGFATVQALGKHQKGCDGIFRTAQERRRQTVRASREKQKEAKENPVMCIDCDEDTWFKNKSALNRHRLKDHAHIPGKVNGHAEQNV